MPRNDQHVAKQMCFQAKFAAEPTLPRQKPNRTEPKLRYRMQYRDTETDRKYGIQHWRFVKLILNGTVQYRTAQDNTVQSNGVQCIVIQQPIAKPNRSDQTKHVKGFRYCPTNNPVKVVSKCFPWHIPTRDQYV